MTLRQMLARLNPHIEDDEDQFLSVALQTAAQDASRGARRYPDGQPQDTIESTIADPAPLAERM